MKFNLRRLLQNGSHLISPRPIRRPFSVFPNRDEGTIPSAGTSSTVKPEFWYEFYLGHFENTKTKPFVSSTFVRDVQNLRREFGLVSGLRKPSSNELCDSKLRTLYIQQQLGLHPNRMSLKALNDSFRLLTLARREKIAEDSRVSYLNAYASLTAKYQTPVPKFLDLSLIEQMNDSFDEKIQLEKKYWNEFLERAAQDRQEHIQNLLLNSGEELDIEKKVRMNRVELRSKYKFHRHIEFRATPYILFLGSLKKKDKNVSNAELRERFPPSKWTTLIDETDVRFYEIQSRTMFERYTAQNRQSSLEAILNEDWLALKPSEVKSYAPEKFEVYEQAVERFKCTLRNPVEVIHGRTTTHFGPILQGSLPPTLTQIRTLARDQQTSKESSRQADDLMKNKRKEYNFSTNKNFTQSPIRLFANRKRKENSNLKSAEIKEMFKREVQGEALAVLQKESDDLRLLFNQQNKMAAEAAIASRDWAALRKAEVKKYGSSEEYNMYLEYSKSRG